MKMKVTKKMIEAGLVAGYACEWNRPPAPAPVTCQGMLDNCPDAQQQMKVAEATIRGALEAAPKAKKK